MAGCHTGDSARRSPPSGIKDIQNNYRYDFAVRLA